MDRPAGAGRRSWRRRWCCRGSGGSSRPGRRCGSGDSAGGGGRGAAAPAAARTGGLKIATTNLKAQYLRQNGVPVSEKAVVTEFYDIVPGPDGNQWLVVKTQVDDPTYLSGWYQVSSQFKKEANNSKW